MDRVDPDLPERHRARQLEGGGVVDICWLGSPGALVVDLFELGGRRWRNEPVIDEREVGDGETGFVVPHDGAGDQLEIDDAHREDAKREGEAAGKGAERGGVLPPL